MERFYMPHDVCTGAMMANVLIDLTQKTFHHARISIVGSKPNINFCNLYFFTFYIIYLIYNTMDKEPVGYQQIVCDRCNKKSIYISKICSDCLREEWNEETRD